MAENVKISNICMIIVGILWFFLFMFLGIILYILGKGGLGTLIIFISLIPLLVMITIRIVKRVRTQKGISPRKIKTQKTKQDILTEEEFIEYLTGARAKRPSSRTKSEPGIVIRTIPGEVKQWVLTPEKGLSLESERDLARRSEAIQLNELGLRIQQQGNIAQAAEYYLKAINLYPEIPEPYGNLGGLYVLTGNFSEAIKYYLNAISLDNSNISFHTGIAAAYMYTSQFEKAMKELDIAEKINPENMAFIMNKGSLLYTAQKHKESAEYHEKILAADKIKESDQQRLATCNYRLAYAYAHLKKTQKAMKIVDEYLEKPFVKGSNQQTALFIQAKVKAWQMIKKYNLAIELLREKLKSDSMNLMYLNCLSSSLVARSLLSCKNFALLLSLGSLVIKLLW